MNQFYKIIVFLALIPTLLLAEELGDKNTVINKATSSITNSISNTFGKLTAFNGIKKAELEFEGKDQDFQSDIRASIISSLSENEEM